MASRRKSRYKKINPCYFVFCEGETEEEYVKFLKRNHRIPIAINAKRTGDNISQQFINSYLSTKTKHEKDKIFLMFDLDVKEKLEKLRRLIGILLASNPCFELWFLLHHKEQRANISSNKCIGALKKVKIWTNYKKGQLDENQKKKLINFCDKAIERSHELNLYKNPSTSVDKFIRCLNEAKKS